MRAGTCVLPMAANAIKREILRSVLEQPGTLFEGDAYRVSEGGKEMLFVSFVAERWLQNAPGGPLPLEGDDEDGAVATLVEGWKLMVVHALAREPLSLRELRGVIRGVHRGDLKRCLEAMRGLGQVEARSGGSDDARYAVTDWLRAAIAPLAAAARLERREPKDWMAPIDEADVETAFLLTLPLLELPDELSGSCRLEVELSDSEPQLAGVTAHVESGRVVACALQLDDHTDAWASASAGGWLDTVIEPDAERVTTGGDRLLAGVLLDNLHETLFGIPVL